MLNADFPFYQFDLALRRRFSFTEFVKLQVQADAFNLFNHQNFEDPVARDRVIERLRSGHFQAERNLRHVLQRRRGAGAAFFSQVNFLMHFEQCRIRQSDSICGLVELPG